MAFLSAVRMLATKIRMSSSISLRHMVKFAGVPSLFMRLPVATSVWFRVVP
jgi:hypothetical protein